MVKKRLLAVDWTYREADLDAAIKHFEGYLKNRGFRRSTMDGYLACVGIYLKFAKTDRPSSDDAIKFRETLLDKNLARSTLNNYTFSIKCYHKMYGEDVSLPFTPRNNNLPYYFDQDDVSKIFSVVHNIKHLAMLKTLFFGCFRVTELCNLDDGDLDLDDLTIRVREGKGGRDGIVYITDDCAATLRRYLSVRPAFEIDGKCPLFYTDYGRRWGRGDVYRMFISYKGKAGIEKHGGVHVFSRHTAATIMIANGCDLRTVQELLRHRDIRTTLRYAHVSDTTKRKKYNECLTL
jgi:integrase/recombinase XerD